MVLELQCSLQQAVNANNVLFVSTRQDMLFVQWEHVTLKTCDIIGRSVFRAEEVALSVMDGVENDKEKTVDLTSQILMQINRVILRLDDVLAILIPIHNKLIGNICEKVVSDLIFLRDFENTPTNFVCKLELINTKMLNVCEIFKVVILDEIEMRQEMKGWKELRKSTEWKFQYYHNAVIDFVIQFKNPETFQFLTEKVNEFDLEQDIGWRCANTQEENFTQQLLDGLKKSIKEKIETYVPSVKTFTEECVNFHHSCDVLLQSLNLFFLFPETIKKVKQSLEIYCTNFNYLLMEIQLFDYMSHSISKILCKKCESLSTFIKELFASLDGEDFEVQVRKKLQTVYCALTEIAGISFVQKDQTDQVIKILSKAISRKNREIKYDADTFAFLLQTAEKISLCGKEPFNIISESISKNPLNNDTISTQRAFAQIYIVRNIWQAQNANLTKKGCAILKKVINIHIVKNLDELAMTHDQLLVEEKEVLMHFGSNSFEFVGYNEVHERRTIGKMTRYRCFTSFIFMCLKKYYIQLIKMFIMSMTLIKAFVDKKQTERQLCVILKQLELTYPVVDLLFDILVGFDVEVGNVLVKTNVKNKMTNVIMQSVKFFEKHNVLKTQQFDEEMYENKEELLKDFRSIQSFLQITESQIHRVVIEEQLFASNRQNFMLAVDMCLGNTDNEQINALFDSQRDLLTQVGKLSKRTVPFFCFG
ncbi:hypothetical protein EIN_138200 [Entamoeba invadens IP1]|uniref:Uncharacterized protein n=1 Tax=Entamoeba invadens IP1 TaxID=370355 RepID=L7FND1_ENTIV|nr:hypothetical protein EIN_138200 [Entamoeba invadens IP1]ELP91803.1 hypothetical protein EIN_138200 [Entamoeba invadens IP1]|eukprot:XP_004258574.1 hypothetical protein EIN_138200 [Entamoeba invadens IP1]